MNTQGGEDETRVVASLEANGGRLRRSRATQREPLASACCEPGALCKVTGKHLAPLRDAAEKTLKRLAESE